MARPKRVAVGGLVYHALNRANGRLPLFDTPADYAAFERVLAEAVDRFATRLLAYCLMPNHWHLVLWPREDGELSLFMRWLALTHAQRRHAHRHSAGEGHLYQGRFKSFPVETDRHFLLVARYVERNALRARLVRRAENWSWSSLRRREEAKPDAAQSVPMSEVPEIPALHPWPVQAPREWLELVNTPMTGAEERAVQSSIMRGSPFGASQWQITTARRLGLLSTLRPRGRPAKKVER